MTKKFAIVLALFLIAVVCSAGCILPSDPVDPVEPVDPVVPDTPVVPDEPEDPVVPDEPVDPVVPEKGDYTVTFLMNSAVDSGVYLTVYVDEGETVAEPAVPEKPKAQYIFVQWTTDKENRHAYDFTTPVTADLVLYADWDVMGVSSGSGHSHSYTATVTTEATCSADGVKTYTCSCGASYTEAILATGNHSYAVVTPATCVIDGLEKCDCGNEQIIPATGHNVVDNMEDGTFAPKCSVCGETYAAMLSTQANEKNTYHTKVEYAVSNASVGNTIHLAMNMDKRIPLDKEVIISAHNHKVNLSYTDTKDIKILKNECTIGNVDVTVNGNPVGFEIDADSDYLRVVDELVSVSNDDELASAISSGKVNIFLKPGTYHIPSAAKGKTLNLYGTKETVIEVVGSGVGENGGQSDYNLDGSTVTFRGVTIKTNNKTYAGYARLTGTYEGCTFEMCYCLYRASKFTDCEFNVGGDQYNIWTWGAPTAEFTGCTFNSDGKAMLLYGGENTKLTLNNCVFNDNGGLTDLKAAVEIGNDYNKAYELIVNGCTVNGYEINDNGINTGTTLWANKNSMGTDKLNVVVDGVDVY